MRLKLCLALIAVGVLTACSANGGGGTEAKPVAALANHPVSGLKVIPLMISANGKRHSFLVEVAGTEAEQAKGLMFRANIGANEGMIFPMNPPRQAAFWMRNTVIPLDIIYVGTDRRILNIANAVPYDERPLPSAGEAALVLELNGGRAAALGIGPGDRVDW